jgi:hypothetical protein
MESYKYRLKVDVTTSSGITVVLKCACAPSMLILCSISVPGVLTHAGWIVMLHGLQVNAWGGYSI